MSPQFVDGGRAVVYVAQTRFNQLSLLRLPLDVTAPAAESDDRRVVAEPLHPGAVTSELAPACSTNQRTFAYVRNNGNLHVALVIEDREQSATVEVDPGGGFAGIQYVTVSPDGQRVVYAFPERPGGGQQLVSVSRTGQDKRLLTAGDEFDSCPRFSPDGRQLAFASTRAGNFDVYVSDAAGQNAYPVTSHPGLDQHPDWSPDGRQLAYVSLRNGNFDVYLLKRIAPATTPTATTSPAETGEPRESDPQAVRLTDHPERDDYPVWHPSGKHLLTVSERDGQHDLYLWEIADR